MKNEEKASISNSNEDDSEERELDDILDDESEKSQKIKYNKSTEFKKYINLKSNSRLQHTLSATNLAQLTTIPKLRRKKFYSISKRLSKSSANIGKLQNKISRVSHFYYTHS